MSLTRHKIAFRNAFGAREDFDAMWQRFASAMVAEAGGESLWIPESIPDPCAAQLQGDLFARHRDDGMTIRQIADATQKPKTTVHRILSQRREGLGTAA